MKEGAVPVKPYKGLVPYDEEDAPFFFGRDSQRETIVANLMASRLTLLYGPSGVGKSSVLRAGVAHHLGRLKKLSLAERGGRDFAYIVFSAWRDDPIKGLRESIKRSRSLDKPAAGTWSNHQQNTLAAVLDAWSQQIDGDVYVILDQFEEYFLYHSHEDSFTQEFAQAVNASGSRINFLISIREDALAKLDRFKGRIPRLFDNYLRIEHLDPDAARQAIEGPIDRFNQLLAEHDPKIEIEKPLVDAVLEQVQAGRVTLGETGRGGIGLHAKKDQIETPYLQLVMTRLWDEEVEGHSSTLRLETLERLGNAENIVRTHLDKTMSSLSADEQDIAARAFNFLVTPSGTKIAHDLRDLAKYTLIPGKQLAPVLDKLASGNIRILRTVAFVDNPSAPPRYEIFHDVLAAAILDWRARFDQDQDSLEERMAREQRRVWLLRIGLIGSLAIAGLLIWLSFYSILKRSQALDGANRVLSLRYAAEATENFANDRALSILLAKEAVEVAPTTEAEAILRKSLVNYPSAGLLSGHTNLINSVVFSPDNRLLVTASGDRTARIWDVVTGKSIRELKGHDGPLWSASFSHDGRLVVTASTDHTARVWDLATGAARVVLKHGDDVRSAVFSPDDRVIATTSDDPIARVRVFDATTGNLLGMSSGHTDTVYTAEFNPGGNLIVTASRDGKARIWEWQKGPESSPLEHAMLVYTAKFSPDGKLVATASQDHTAQVWDVATAKSVANFQHNDIVYSAVFNATGSQLVTACNDGTAAVWDIATGQRIALMSGHYLEVDDAKFSANGALVVTGSKDNTAKLWNAHTGEFISSFECTGEHQHLMTVGIDRDATIIFATDGNYDVRLLKVPRADQYLPFAAAAIPDVAAQRLDEITREKLLAAISPGSLSSIAFSSDLRLVATTGDSYPTRVWDVATQTVVAELKSFEGWVNGGAFSPDSRLIVTAGPDSAARIWEISSGKQLRELKGHGERVTTAAFSPDGKLVLTGSWDKTARLWNAVNGEVVATLSGHTNYITDAAFSPDGQFIATASDDQTARIWSVTSKALVAELRGHGAPVESIAFNFNGRLVVSAGSDNTVRVWNWSAESERNTPVVLNERLVRSAAFTPEGRFLVIERASQQAKTYSWELFAPLSDLTSAVSSRVTRLLTPEERQEYLRRFAGR